MQNPNVKTFSMPHVSKEEFVAQLSIASESIERYYLAPRRASHPTAEVCIGGLTIIVREVRTAERVIQGDALIAGAHKNAWEEQLLQSFDTARSPIPLATFRLDENAGVASVRCEVDMRKTIIH